jgi:hypothetical protein
MDSYLYRLVVGCAVFLASGNHWLAPLQYCNTRVAIALLQYLLESSSLPPPLPNAVAVSGCAQTLLKNNDILMTEWPCGAAPQFPAT